MTTARTWGSDMEDLAFFVMVAGIVYGAAVTTIIYLLFVSGGRRR